MKILVINPGSTSTKMAVFEDETSVLVRNIVHTPEELAQFDDVMISVASWCSTNFSRLASLWSSMQL